MINYMVLPDKSDGFRVWYQDSDDNTPDCWSIIWGDHDIELVDGIFYNYYESEPTEIGKLVEARFMTQRVVEAVTKDEDFHDFTGYKLFCAKATCAQEKTALRRYL